MLARVLKAVAYLKAPRRTFVALHPLKALKWMGIAALVSLLFRRRERRRLRSPGR